MKPNEAQGNSKTQSVHPRQRGSAKFKKVFDARKQRIRGLWRRGFGFYAQLTAEDAIKYADNYIRYRQLEVIGEGNKDGARGTFFICMAGDLLMVDRYIAVGNAGPQSTRVGEKSDKENQ